MWFSPNVLYLASDNKVATPGWVIDTLHAYGEFFQKTFIFNQILRVIGIQLIMLLYAIDSLFSKIIFLILGMSTASDATKTGAAFNGTILGLLGDGGFQTLVKVGMGLGLSALGLAGIWIYLKMFIGKPVALSEVFTNLFTTVIIIIATPTLLIISLRGGSFVFGSLAMRNFTTDPQTKEVEMANNTDGTKNLGDDFVWSFINTDIVATGDAVTGQYLVNSDNKRILNSNWDDKKVQDDASNAFAFNDVIKNNFPNDGRKQDIGAVATGTQIANFRNSFSARRELITSSAGSWTAELMRRIPLPSDVQRKKDGNWWDKIVAAWEKTVQGSDRKSNWGLLSGYSYDYDTYNIQDKTQEEGSGSHLIPVSQGDFLPFSSGHYYYYSINWSVIITLLALFFLLFDIFCKLLIAFLDICATLLIGWGGMTATIESGRGNAIFIEEILNYGKVCLVSGMSLGLYVVVTNFLKTMFSTLKTSGSLNGIETMVASPIVLMVVTFAFFNGSGAFIKFVGVDAGFGYAGGAFGTLFSRNAFKKVAGKTKEAAGGAMKKGINAISKNKTQDSVEKAAAKDENHNYKKAEQIFKKAEKQKNALEGSTLLPRTSASLAPQMSQIDEARDVALEQLANKPTSRHVLKKDISLQEQAQQRLGVLGSKVEHGIATEEEQNEYNLLNQARTGYARPNLAQKMAGVDAKSLSAFDSTGQRNGAVDLGRLAFYKERLDQTDASTRETPIPPSGAFDPYIEATSVPKSEQKVTTQAEDQTVNVTEKAGQTIVKHTNSAHSEMESLYGSMPEDPTGLRTHQSRTTPRQVTRTIEGQDIEVTNEHLAGKIVRENNHQVSGADDSKLANLEGPHSTGTGIESASQGAEHPVNRRNRNPRSLPKYPQDPRNLKGRL